MGDKLAQYETSGTDQKCRTGRGLESVNVSYNAGAVPMLEPNELSADVNGFILWVSINKFSATLTRCSSGPILLNHTLLLDGYKYP